MRGLLFITLLLLAPLSWAQDLPAAPPEAEAVTETSNPEPPAPAEPEEPPPVTADEDPGQQEVPDPRPSVIRNATFSRHGPGVLAPGQMSVGLFAPLRVGVLEDLELSAHPLLSLLSPQVEARKVWTGGADWLVSTSHAIGSPTPLLSTLSREGIGGILPADTEVPFILATKHHVRYGTTLGLHHRITARLGFGAALHSVGEALPSIDLALVYPRSAHWIHGFVADLGLDLEGNLAGPLGYGLDLDVFLVPDGDASWHIEQGAYLRWRMTTSSQLLVGMKATYGQYPFGVQQDLLPVVDLQWDFQAWGDEG